MLCCCSAAAVLQLSDIALGVCGVSVQGGAFVSCLCGGSFSVSRSSNKCFPQAASSFITATLAIWAAAAAAAAVAVAAAAAPA